MRRQSKFLSAAIFIMTVAISFPAPASSLSRYRIPDAGYRIPDAGCRMLDAGCWMPDTRSQAGMPVPLASRVSDPDGEAAVQQDRGFSDPIADSLSAALPKSPGKAFLFSAAVPGTGEFYSGAKRGVLFVAAEVAFWAAYVVLHGRGEELKDDYLKFCDEHIVFEEDSPANSTKSWTLEDYEHATQSDNWHYVYTESNGKPIERVGKFHWADLPEDMIDQPGDKPLSESQSQFRTEAFAKRSSTNDKFKQAKMFLGLVVLNHIISAVDARIAATVYNHRISETSAKISFHPTVFPSGHLGAHLTLHGRF